jgi:hypothetical protein
VKLGYDDKLRLLGESETLKPSSGKSARNGHVRPDAGRAGNHPGRSLCDCAVTSIRAFFARDSRGASESVVESLEIAATSAAAELGVDSVLSAIGQYVVVFSAL